MPAAMQAAIMGGPEKQQHTHTDILCHCRSRWQGFDQAAAQKYGCTQSVTAAGVGVRLTLVPE